MNADEVHHLCLFELQSLLSELRAIFSLLCGEEGEEPLPLHEDAWQPQLEK